MYILGINFNHPDTSACIVKNGKVIFAIEEERLTRIKSYSGFPYLSIKLILKKFNLSLDDINYITSNNSRTYNFYNKFITYINLSIKYKNLNFAGKYKSLESYFFKYFDYDISKKYFSFYHHLCHASFSYFSSKFKNSTILSFDGFGNFSSIEIFQKNENKNFKNLYKTIYPHSLGILYQSICQFLGFNKYGDEFKVMALAAMGKNKFEKEFDNLYFFRKNNFYLNLKYFSHYEKNIFLYEDGYPFFPPLFSNELVSLFGCKQFKSSNFSQKKADIACSLQACFEKVSFKLIDIAYNLNPSENLILTGGCALNSVLNGKIVENSKFKKVYINNCSGDAGGAVGSALLQASRTQSIHSKEIVYCGLKYSNSEIKVILSQCLDKIKNNKIKVRYIQEEAVINLKIAKLISKNKVVGIFRDKMEFGPRALGNRSILANPKNKNIKKILNNKIKNRELFRPFACSILEGYEDKYFHIQDKYNLNLMNKVFKVKENNRKNILGVVHVDNTSRIQTVNKFNNKRFYNLLHAIKKIINLPMVLNTSLNNQEPICCSPKDAINFFLKTKIDTLVIENFILER